MYFSFIYDHNYLKLERDFYGDAIVAFNPIESKEKHIYLIGQLIGMIDFFKRFMIKLNVNMFKMDKLIVFHKSFNTQFSLVLATDQMALNNELLIKKKLLVYHDLIQTVNGQLINADRSDEGNYEAFKQKLAQISAICFRLVFKNRHVQLNSYFTSVAFSLQSKLELRFKYLFDYALKKVKAFNGILFYNENKVLYTKIRNGSLINLLYFVTSEESSLIDWCRPLNSDLNLPSGFYLVKIHLLKVLYERLELSNISEMRSDETENFLQLKQSFNCRNQKQSENDNTWNETVRNEIVLEMDVLPESTRFTSNVNRGLRLVDEKDEEYLMNDSHNEVIAHDNSKRFEEVVVYVQKNSRLKLVLLTACANMVQIPYEEIIRIWQNIVSSFSHLECEILEQEREDEIVKTTQPISWLSSSGSFSKLPTNQLNDSAFSCIVDRNRLIKHSTSSTSNNAGFSNNLPNVAKSNITNINLFYELTQSIPELSKFEINKKGFSFTYLKQNMVALSSTSLEESKPELSKRNALMSSQSPLLPFSNNNIDNKKSKQKQASNDNQLDRSKVGQKLITMDINEKIEYELVDKARSKSSLSSESHSSSSISSLTNTSTPSTSTSLNYLQYGDVFICLNPSK